RLKLAPRAPDIRPVARAAAPVAEPQRKLSLAEKQLIQGVLQRPEIAAGLEPLLRGDFLSGIWSGPVLKELAKDPVQNVETILETIQDDDLKKEVRAALLEPFGPISEKQALASVQRLYDGHLVKKLEEVRDQLKQYGSGAAPAELVRKHMEIVAEK